jgi:hypothetical protein
MSRSARERSAESAASDHRSPPKTPGAWVLWPEVEALCRLKLKPSSHWQVLLTVYLTSQRYNGNDARLSVADIARMTGLAERTVKGAVTVLRRQKLLVRVGRYRRLKVDLPTATTKVGGADTVAPPVREQTIPGGADMSAPRKGNHVCPSPTSLYVSSSCIREISSGESGTFSGAQQRVIDDVVAESFVLLGSDPMLLTISAWLMTKLGLESPITYADAYDQIVAANDRRGAGLFVRAVLALRQDERVQGRELLLG